MMLKRTIQSFSLLAVLGMSACVKDSNQQLSGYDNNKINLVVADNFNLSAFSATLRRSALDQLLQKGEGPYTLLAPSDAAFNKYGYGSPLAVLGADGNLISRIAYYHTLDGKYELNKLPYLFNQELRSRGGKIICHTLDQRRGHGAYHQWFPPARFQYPCLQRVDTGD